MTIVEAAGDAKHAHRFKAITRDSSARTDALEFPPASGIIESEEIIGAFSALIAPLKTLFSRCMPAAPGENAQYAELNLPTSKAPEPAERRAPSRNFLGMRGCGS